MHIHIKTAAAVALMLGMLATFSAPARAQLALADLQSKMVGTWLTTVEGEPRTRNLVIDVVAQKAEGTFVMTGSFTFSDGSKPAAFKDGEILQSSGNVTLVFTTGADSVYTATLKPDGTLAGTTKYKNGQVKAVTMVKGAVAAPVAAGPRSLSKTEVQDLIAGKRVRWRHVSSNEITWQLEAGGRLFGQTSAGGRDDGTWSINDVGQVCTQWNGRSNSGCFFVVKRGDRTVFLSVDRKPYGEILDIN